MERYHGRPADATGRPEKELRCYDALDALGIAYDRVDHPHADTIDACLAIEGCLGAKICKNLFLCNRQKTEFYLLLLPGDKPFQTKVFSKLIGVSRLSFADADAMLHYLDITPGSVSILGLMNDREKADTLLKIIGVGDRLAAFDREIRALYDRRTTIGQIAEQKKHFAEEQVEYHDAPDEPVSVSELIRSQQEILARNGENQRKRERAAQLAQHVKDLQERVDSLAAQLQQASEQCANAMKDLETAQKSAEDLQDESTAELEASIRDAEEINRKVRANLDKARAEDEARSYADQYKALTDSIDAKRQERRALLDGADLPLPGLSVDDGALTYQGKRWGDMSGSDQLRVATAIVRKLNPECGFVLLDKLEQMDLRTLTDFGSWLASEGLQAIATRVSTGGECQIIIEDGRVQGADITPAPQPRQWTKGAF